MSSTTVKLEFLEVEKNSPYVIASLTLNRPEVSNAFSSEMVETFLSHLETIARRGDCRAAIIRGEGKNFCAGGDLEWMRQSALLPEHKNIEEARKFSSLFGAVYRLPIPTVAFIQGACYGGGVGIAAVCDWAIAADDAKFCLSEVKVGLGASIILPYVSHKISMGHLHRFVLTARVFTSEEAMTSGLVQRIAPYADFEKVIREEMNAILIGSPTAQRSFKETHHWFLDGTPEFVLKQEDRMVENIARLRASENGLKGLNAFLQKSKPDWVVSLSPEWKP